MDKEDIEIYRELINKYKNKFSYNEYNGIMDKQGECSYEWRKGKLPIIVSAPHSVNQIRNGKLKIADGITGTMSIILSEITNCFCIYKKYNDGKDANYDKEDGGYKEKVVQLIKENNIKLLIDLHAAANFRDFDVDIGTDFKRNLIGNTKVLNEMIACIKDKDIKGVKIDSTFTASNPNTITKNTSTVCQIPCMQLEISGNYKIDVEIEPVSRMLDALKNFILMQKF